MTNNAELIERAKALSRMPYAVRTPAHDIFDELITALEAPPFDVLQHLRDGGKITRAEFPETGYWFYKNGVLCSAHTPPEYWTDLLNFFEWDDWQPYHEPPVEGSREWAMEQDCDVTHIHWCGWQNFVQETSDDGKFRIMAVWKDSRFDNGWSLYVEPRAPGYYSATLPYQDIDIFRWTGENWICHAGHSLVEGDFLWIGKTRIELETPKTETSHIFGSEGEGL